jgi:hypothetical protein
MSATRLYLLSLIGSLLSFGRLSASEAETIFALKVLPILKAKCLACHGDDPEKLKGNFDLRSREKLLAGGDSGPALIPGKAKESALYRAVTRTDESISAMPPKENDKLTESEVKAFREWIDGGAPWPGEKRIREIVEASKPSGVQVKTSGGLSPDWTNRRYQPEDLWAYQPLKKISIPEGGENPVDAFLNAKMKQMGIAPAPSTNRQTLIRRVTFDLTGLPPTPPEVEAFLQDSAEDRVAFEKVIDRLLASPHYGEKMARHWLDVTRYADSSGFANDFERGNAWRYRDYVVRSFNQDKPYPQFIREQIAGDEIDPNSPELLIAVGFLRMGAWELTGMEVPRIARQRFLDDITDAVGQTFLGQMLQCARCHDHKFDPVPTRDYYRIQAAFATTQITERSAPFLAEENRCGFEERKYLEARRKSLEAELNRIQSKEKVAQEKWLAEHPEAKGQKPPRHEFLSPADLGMERIARKGLERLKWEFDRYEPFALSVYSGHTPNLKSILNPFRLPKDLLSGEREVTAILAGGDPFSATQKVTPGVLSIAGEANLPETVSGRRLALANWIADERCPLTARVMANRIWLWTMGTALAGNPNNFGATGKKPTHPELLDWLAGEFFARGWSMKQLQRLILTSEAYRRTSQHPDPKLLASKDPSRISYAIHAPRRLTAEELRDVMLMASGELNPMLGGIPVRPEIHPDVALQPRQVMGTFAAAWEPSPSPAQRHRRTLYALQLRGVRDPFLDVFNAPSPELSCESRDLSTVAPQAFALMNNATMRDRSLALAAKLMKETKTPEEAIRLAFTRTISRLPTERERELCLTHWRTETERHRQLKFELPPRIRELTREAVEENTGEKFRFVERFESAADFVPDLHPSQVSAEVRGLMEVCLVLLNLNEFVYLD